MSGSMQSYGKIGCAIDALVEVYTSLKKEEFINLEICGFNIAPDLMIKTFSERHISPEDLKVILWDVWKHSGVGMSEWVKPIDGSYYTGVNKIFNNKIRKSTDEK